MRYETGTAIFLPLEHSLRIMRQSTKRALLNHHSPKPFKVLHEELYYPNAIDCHLEMPEILSEIILPFEGMISGEKNGIFNCIALVEIGTGPGLLLHRSNGLLFAAYLPFPTWEEVCNEQQLMNDLIQLAKKSKTTRIHLDRILQPGSYPLKELLQLIAESIE